MKLAKRGGDQTDMTRLKPKKLHVQFSAGTTPEGPVTRIETWGVPAGYHVALGAEQ
jgi:hypothetical protein